MNQQQPPPEGGTPPGAQAASATHPDNALEEGERAALERLIGHAKSDTIQSPRVADFLLAWWDAASCGGFDLTKLWGLDDAIAADAVTVFALVARVNLYPDRLGYEADFKAIARAWRPALAD